MNKIRYLLLIGALSVTACNPAKLAPLPKLEGKVIVEKNLAVPMEDGVRLIGDLYHPPGAGPWPCIVNRLPYGVQSVDPFARLFAGAGYAVFVQDTRGRYRSEGGGDIFMPFVSEEADGRQTIKWVKKQKWCNGKIGTWGGSYHGYTQWAMASDNPDLSAIEPLVTGTDLYRWHYTDGALRFQMMLEWGAENRGHKSKQFVTGVKRAFWRLPLIEADDAAKGQWPWWDMVLSHPTKDDFWKPLDFSDRLARVSAPALFVSGWYDIFNVDQLRDYEKWEARGAGAPKARLIVGPWNHVFYNTNLKNVEWGWKDAADKVLGQGRQWFDRWLCDRHNGIDEAKRVNVYVMGEDSWRDFDEWPPKSAKVVSFFLNSSGKANSSNGDGALSSAPPAEDRQDSFDYDPSTPVPTLGGAALLPWEAGPADQRKIEERNDVLVYSTEAIKKPLIVIGPIKLKLFAATSAVDTDFTAKLVDVYPDGKAIIVKEGILRGRYMGGDRAKPLEPGKVYEWNIDLGYVALKVNPGHQMRLEISSSNFPRFSRNLNTGENEATGTKMLLARQIVYHSTQYPSALCLSVLDK